MSVEVLAIENRIKQRIEELNLDVESVAQDSGITTEYLYKIIAGKRKPSLKIQFALAFILKCKVEDIFMPKIKTQSLQKCGTKSA